jgi:hypothetical protein
MPQKRGKGAPKRGQKLFGEDQNLFREDRKLFREDQKLFGQDQRYAFFGAAPKNAVGSRQQAVGRGRKEKKISEVGEKWSTGSGWIGRI